MNPTIQKLNELICEEYNLYTEFKIYFNGQQIFDLDLIRDLVKG